MDDLMICIENVSKKYKLGQIGGTTIREELQRRRAKRRGEEDPTSIIGAEEVEYGQEFMALDGISFNVKKGERVGIIGHNGAGKSTLLKLLSHITAPTSGQIGLNGRITSMLEVGTGFHGELTGRENIYMNGAILGMTKKEIDKKIEDIIEFSECRQFIDTPVKRYSSGMYVKLAFAVAAHLDSEIMIMDEVLAVGDMAFQTKCLNKMREVANKENRAVLYVSHNMNTIRQLCDRCIVLKKGKMIYDGDVETAIGIYSGQKRGASTVNDYNDVIRDASVTTDIVFDSLCINDDIPLKIGSKLNVSIKYFSKIDTSNLIFRFNFYPGIRDVFGTARTGCLEVKKDTWYQESFCIDVSSFAPGRYRARLVAYEPDFCGQQNRYDCIDEAFVFDVYSDKDDDGLAWESYWWGSYIMPPIEQLD